MIGILPCNIFFECNMANTCRLFTRHTGVSAYIL